MTAPVFSCWAVMSPGLEPLVQRELGGLQVRLDGVEPGGVAFSATPALLAEALLHSRVASRLTVRIGAFDARTFAELEKHAARVPWSDFIPAGSAVHFRVTSKKSRLYHQDAIAERLERVTLATVSGSTAVRSASAAEAMEDDLAVVPGVQRIIVRIFRDQVTLSADASGALMHLRGWRQAVARAPMRETLAAALLDASGWTHALPSPPLVDPFCGSGTIVIEAALRSRRMAAGRGRRFAAEGWPIMPAGVFASVRAASGERELPPGSAELVGFDRDEGAITAARANAARAGVAEDVRFERATISQLAPDGREGFVITNPPYGARIGERTALRDLYATLGRVMVERRPNWSLTMLSADHMLEVQTRLPLRELARTTNGGIPVRIVQSDG